MTTATLTKTRKTGAKRTTGEWNVMVAGLVVDTVVVEFNRAGGPESDSYRYSILSDDDATGTDDRDEVRQMVADHIRYVRGQEIEARRDRDNDELDGAIETIKDAGKAAKAIEVLRAAGLI